MLADITPVILTYNEEENIGRCLGNLVWAKSIVVVDSNSADRTAEICAGFPNVSFHRRAFVRHADQWDFAVHGTGITTEWVLALDCDYMLDSDFVAEIADLHPDTATNGYRAAFDYVMMGKKLRCGSYPPVTVLFRRPRCRYVQDGHTQRLVAAGAIGMLRTRLAHDDRKPLARWVRSQVDYAELEASKLHGQSQRRLLDHLRTTVPVSWLLVPLYILVCRLGVLDGYAGWAYALQRCIAECLISLFYIRDLVGRR